MGMLNYWKLRGYTLYNPYALYLPFSAILSTVTTMKLKKKTVTIHEPKISDICSLNHPVGKYIIRTFGGD